MGQGQKYPLPAAAAFATAARFSDQVGTKFMHALSFEEFNGQTAAQPAGLVFETPVSPAARYAPSHLEGIRSQHPIPFQFAGDLVVRTLL